MRIYSHNSVHLRVIRFKSTFVTKLGLTGAYCLERSILLINEMSKKTSQCYLLFFDLIQSFKDSIKSIYPAIASS